MKVYFQTSFNSDVFLLPLLIIILVVLFTDKKVVLDFCPMYPRIQLDFSCISVTNCHWWKCYHLVGLVRLQLLWVLDQSNAFSFYLISFRICDLQIAIGFCVYDLLLEVGCNFWPFVVISGVLGFMRHQLYRHFLKVPFVIYPSFLSEMVQHLHCNLCFWWWPPTNHTSHKAQTCQVVITDRKVGGTYHYLVLNLVSFFFHGNSFDLLLLGLKVCL